jgi:murein peptide amidase A
MLDAIALCLELSRPLPSVPDKLCSSVKLEASHAQSVQGHAILQRDVVPNSALAPIKRRVLVLGGIHGDERSASSLVFHWIGHAETTPAETHWRFIPALNPDGLLAKRPHRTNANGVDLNRNFPTPESIANWQRDAVGYWASKTKRDPRRFPGNKPLSEPESQFLYDQIKSFKPDIIVSIHAPFGVLDFDGPSVPPEKLGRLYLDQVGIYPGSLGNYGGKTLGIPVVTVELPNASKAPSSAEMRQMWLDLVRWMSAHSAQAPVPNSAQSPAK